MDSANTRDEYWITARPWIAGAYEIDCDACGWSAVRIGYRATMQAVEAHRESHARATH